MYTKTILHFSELSTQQFHDIIQLREKVFVVEQKCPYLDVDGKDLECHHLNYWDGNQVIANARLLPPNERYPNSSIGRMLIHPDYRKRGLATTMMIAACDFLFAEYPDHNIKIGAQVYLKDFYASLGFKIQGKEYVVDRIVHIHMIKKQ